MQCYQKGVVRELKPMNNGVSMPVNQVCDITLIKTLNTDIINDFVNDNIVLKPYLRPLSSMTEEEYQEFGYDVLRYTPREFDWLIARHFDYRGLIPIGLALRATRDMYKTK